MQFTYLSTSSVTLDLVNLDELKIHEESNDENIQMGTLQTSKCGHDVSRNTFTTNDTGEGDHEEPFRKRSRKVRDADHGDDTVEEDINSTSMGSRGGSHRKLNGLGVVVKGQPKAADYDEETHSVLNTAISMYYVTLLKNNPFPPAFKSLVWAQKSWKRAYCHHEVTKKLIPNLLRLVGIFFNNGITLIHG